MFLLHQLVMQLSHDGMLKLQIEHGSRARDVYSMPLHAHVEALVLSTRSKLQGFAQQRRWDSEQYTVHH